MQLYTRRWMGVLCLIGLWTQGSCAQPMCHQTRAAHAIAAGTAPEHFDTAFWAALLLDDAGQDCCGQPTGGPQSVRPTLVGADDVLVSPPLEHQPQMRLVWLKAHRGVGMVSGPLALVTVGQKRIEVAAIGPLSLPDGDYQLRYVDMHAFFAARVDITTCTAQAAKRPQSCRTVMRLLPNIAGLFRAGLSSDADMELSATHALPSVRRVWLRQIEQAAEVEMCQGTVILTESVALQECHTTRTQVPPRIVRQVEAIRSMRWECGSWHASDAPLWQLMAQAECKTAP